MVDGSVPDKGRIGKTKSIPERDTVDTDMLIEENIEMRTWERWVKRY